MRESNLATLRRIFLRDAMISRSVCKSRRVCVDRMQVWRCEVVVVVVVKQVPQLWIASHRAKLI
jgi:hypothetical protein